MSAIVAGTAGLVKFDRSRIALSSCNCSMTEHRSESRLPYCSTSTFALHQSLALIIRRTALFTYLCQHLTT